MVKSSFFDLCVINETLFTCSKNIPKYLQHKKNIAIQYLNYKTCNTCDSKMKVHVHKTNYQNYQYFIFDYDLKSSNHVFFIYLSVECQDKCIHLDPLWYCYLAVKRQDKQNG